ncbi:transglutaminase domain-containing protein [Plantactinospora sp. B6F1]|uniref:transglutaminase domain-containing protein n=1 Tax=Plantactinospora sp. B6F1 TaxID=3158971 RepID=UPI00102CB3FB
MTGVSVDEIDRLVSLLRRIPLHARRFALTPAAARSSYRLDADLLELLVAAGLPHVGTGEDRLFDHHDLLNVSLCLHRRSPQRVAMRYWAAVLDRPVGECREYELSYLPVCPSPGHPGDCRFLLCEPEGRESVRCGAGDGATALLTVRVRLLNDWPPLPDELVAVIQETDGIEFHRVPDSLRWDVGFLLGQGFGDCAATARLLVERGVRRGLTMRPVFGLIVAPPYSAPHFWAEVLVDGRWVPADPGIIRGLIRWDLLDPAWPVYRSPGAFLARLSTRHAFIASHEGVAADVAVRTRQLPTTGASGPGPASEPRAGAG